MTSLLASLSHSLIPPLSQPQPSASRMEPGTVAADPRVRVVQQEHREGEKGGAGANISLLFLFITGPLAWLEKGS